MHFTITDWDLVSQAFTYHVRKALLLFVLRRVRITLCVLYRDVTR